MYNYWRLNIYDNSMLIRIWNYLFHIFRDVLKSSVLTNISKEFFSLGQVTEYMESCTQLDKIYVQNVLKNTIKQ